MLQPTILQIKKQGFGLEIHQRVKALTMVGTTNELEIQAPETSS